jgi:acetylornithine deacetylase/succinyl-diaminopimelate desuccinylase-like protein
MNSASKLQRMRRRSARTALYAGLAAVAVAAAALAAWLGAVVEPDIAVDWAKVDYAARPEVRLLQRYIAIDTSGPDADTAAGAEFLAAQLRAAGVEPTIERLGTKTANLWAILEGDDPRAVVLHHHIDVDPIAHLEAWMHPPFGGEIEGPWLYGRGAFDMKSVAIAQLEAFLRLARRGRRPARSVILLATTGEETGSELGMRWVLRQHPELVERFGVVLTEGGAIEGRSADEVKYWGTEFAQKRLLRATFCDDDRERLEALRRELIASGRGLDRLTLTPEVSTFLAHYAATRDREDFRRLLADPRSLVRDLPAFDSLPNYLKSMFRNEAVPFAVEPAAGSGWTLPVYLHLLPGAGDDRAVADLLPPWRRHGLTFTLYDEGGADHGSPVDHPAMAAIAEVVGRHYPGVPVGPLFLPWTATDSRFVRARGIPSYGFSPFMVLTPEVLRQVQGKAVSERIALPGFVEGVEIYGEVLDRLTD